MDTSEHTRKLNLIDRSFAFAESLPITDRFLLKGATAVFATSLLWCLISLNAAAVVEIPGYGGTLEEGVVGAPRFINPVLAATSADQDLTSLLYAGLMTLGKDGELVPDIAESVAVSEDGLTYHMLLKKNVVFHDNTPLTADDVIFTVSRVQDPLVKSPLRASWEGVTIERLGDYELQFVLAEPYAPFIENLTLGILPKHIWEHATPEELPFSQHNSEPIGAGPYKIARITRNDSGIPESYELEPNRNYFNAIPKIDTLVLRFYPSEVRLVEAFKAGEIRNAGGLSKSEIDELGAARIPFTLSTAPLPRTFTLFFNQNETPLFRDSAVRRALDTVIDRERIVEEALGGYGEAITSPIPPGFKIETAQMRAVSSAAALDEARAILTDEGWKINQETGRWEKTTDNKTTILEFSITTAKTPVFEDTAQLLKARFAELGVPVTIKSLEQSDLIQTVIRPRKYEALLFGAVVGRELDFFSFWHSSQRNDPGLNVALYANIATDALLLGARAARTSEERSALYQKFSEEITKDRPALFLYVPMYTYATAPEIERVALHGIAHGSERFSNIRDWYIEKEAVWPLFTSGAD